MSAANPPPSPPPPEPARIEDDWAANLILMLRGGAPEQCEFCRQDFGPNRRPVPEEGGEWACSECVTRWEKEERERG